MMKKFTFLSLFIVFSMALFAQTRSDVVSVENFKALENNPAATKAIIDSLHYDGDNTGNAIGTNGATEFGVYAFHPAASLAAHAAEGNEIVSLKFYINGIADVASLELRIYTDTSTLAYSEAIPTFVEGWNEFTFTTPYAIGADDIYIGYNLVATGGYPAGCDDGPQDPNGNWMYFGMWTHLSDLAPTLTFNWNLRAMIDGTLPASPTASCTPMAWDAGAIETGTSATSGTFTLSNTTGGTLTVTSATDLTGTMFSTSFVAGDVSLLTGETYDFTFDFDPTADGTYAETFSIETNGGTVDIALDGIGYPPCTNVTTFPWIEGFESMSMGPDFICWEVMYNTAADGGLDGTNLVVPTGATWNVIDETTFGDAQYIYDGVNAAGLGYTAPDFNWLITPSIEMPASGSYDLKFYMWLFNNVANSWITKFYVQVYDGSTWTTIETWDDGSVDNQYDSEIITSLGAYAGQTIQIAFVYEYNDGYELAIDNVTIEMASDVSEIDVNAIAIYPNPTQGIIKVKNAQSIVVYNMIGEVVATATDANELTYIDLTNLANGSYIVKANNGTNVVTKKINLVK